ncbi:MAG TPA: hemerythrin domain-containing protein [Pirellulaceae bacterium]|nr:hemerythrin domain-containing protein [Pirellulaceae bacterium]
MSLATGTLTVNAAFLQEIKEDSRELRQLLCQNVERLNRNRLPVADPLEMIESLAKLRDQLALHFTLEEAYGYFEDAIDAAPQLSVQAEMLRNQHQTLFADLSHVVALAEQLRSEESPMDAHFEVARLFHRFRADLQQHESREQELILAAFNDDLGCGD